MMARSVLAASAEVPFKTWLVFLGIAATVLGFIAIAAAIWWVARHRDARKSAKHRPLQSKKAGPPMPDEKTKAGSSKEEKSTNAEGKKK